MRYPVSVSFLRFCSLLVQLQYTGKEVEEGIGKGTSQPVRKNVPPFHTLKDPAKIPKLNISKFKTGRKRARYEIESQQDKQFG